MGVMMPQCAELADESGAMVFAHTELHHDETERRGLGTMIGVLDAAHRLDVESELLQQRLCAFTHHPVGIDVQDRFHDFPDH